MANAPFSILNCLKYTDQDLIEIIVSNFYIVDYGFITKVNADGTVNVTHAKKLKTLLGESLPDTNTNNIEVLTISVGGFALSVDYKAGDKMLLLGLKCYVPKCGEVSQAMPSEGSLHYERDTLKALPMCVFNENAKVTIKAKDGTLAVDTDKKLEINGNSKQFVTWAELNQALQTLVTTLSAHTHVVAGTTEVGMPITGTAAPVVAPFTIDITSAKTKTVVTGG